DAEVIKTSRRDDVSIVKDDVVIVYRRELVIGVDQVPCDLGLKGGHVMIINWLFLPRVAAKNLVLRGELMVDLRVRYPAFKVLGRAVSEILLRAGLGDDCGRVRLSKRTMQEEVLYYRIDHTDRDLIAWKGVADPGSR